MNSFKNYSKFCIILAILLLIPASTYAIVDLSAYGGYSFAGELENADASSDMNGWQCGLYGHLNTGIPMLLTVGLGGFYQVAPLTVKAPSGDADATKKTAGIDAYAQIDLPFLPVFPYLRYGIAISEKVEVKYPGRTESLSENFKSNYFGFGLSRTLFSAVVWDIQIFAEYLYTTSKQENNVKLKGNAINAGVKVSL